jgi:hypothetical protein
MKFITNELKISHFNILFQKGEKISKNKMQKFDETLSKYKHEEVLNLLLISSENSQTSSKLRDELKMLNGRLEKMGVNNFLSNLNNTKNILEIIFTTHAEIRTIENQNVIMNFLENFYSHLIIKIKNKFQKINDNYKNYKERKTELDFSFARNLEDFKKIFEVLKNPKNEENYSITTNPENITHQKCSEIEIKAIEKSFADFKKVFCIFEEKLKNFDLSLNNFIENHSKLKEKNFLIQNKLDENNIKEQIGIIKQLFNEIGKNLDSNNFKEVLTRVETFWNKNNFKMENFKEIFKLRKTNSQKIKSMLEDQCGRLKKNLLDKLSELNLFNKSIETNLEISELPKILQKESLIIEEEIKKRKEFEFLFMRLMNFMNKNFLAGEEKRRIEYFKFA